jgi:hypothetical protein
VARIPVDLAPEVAEAVSGTTDRRFTGGAVKSAVRWAAGADVTSATVLELTLDTDPPQLVAELRPAGNRVVLYAGESTWTLVPKHVVRLEVPAGVDELDWVMSTLAEVAGVEPARPAHVDRSWEDLGMGEHRSVRSVRWSSGDVRVTAEVAEHEIYDGATPAWTVLRGSVEGLPDGGSATLTATLRGRGPGGGPQPYQPATSAMTWVEPAWLYRTTMPLSLTFTTTKLGTVRPAT